MEINIIAFGQIAEITGKQNWTIPAIADTDALQQELLATYPALANMTYSIAVDKKIIKENTELPNNATIALLPPFSGG